MKFLKSIGRVFNKVSDGGQKLFSKGEIGGQKLFGKGSIGSQTLGDVSKGLSKAGSVINDVGKGIGNVGLQGVGNTLSLAGDMTKQRNYGGSAGNVAANILEKAKSVKESGSGVTFV